MQLLIFVPKLNDSLPDVGDPALRYGRTSYVATGVSQESLFRPEGLNIDAPPTVFLLRE
jgi:hypothetical protein